MKSTPSPESRSKRKATDPLPSPPRVRIRSKATAVKVEKDHFWDERRPPSPSTREAVKRKFRHAASRWNLLEKYGLLYSYKRIKDNEIRLLYINPAEKRDADLVVSVVTIADAQTGPYPRQEYEALSYHWGPGPAVYPIYLEEPVSLPTTILSKLSSLNRLVPDYSKGQRFYVRPNLDNALRHLRHKTDLVVLWVDAICINQNDVKGEKPAQISKMNHIYNNATNVCVWLGDGKRDPNTNGREDRSADFKNAMEFISEVIDLKNLEVLCEDTNQAKRWSNLLDLMRCNWFSRRWVIQELALARDATVHCGDNCVSWQDFADAVGLFALKYPRIRGLLRQSKEDNIYRNYKTFDELEFLGAKMLVDAITNTFRKNLNDQAFEPVWNLETLVSKLSSFESSDPRDAIYALINISRESLLPRKTDPNAVGPPKIDYQRSLLEVYTDFLEWVIYSTNSVDIICRHWALPERKKVGAWKISTPLVPLPSWIQTISKSTRGTQLQSFSGRINGESIVGRAGRRRYNASHGIQPEVRFGTRWRIVPEAIANRTNSAPSSLGAPNVKSSSPPANENLTQRISAAYKLHIKGIEIDRIMWTAGPVSGGVITKECLEKGGWKKQIVRERQVEEYDKVPDKLWRSLVADRDAEGDNTPPWYHRAAIYCMTLTDNNGHIPTRELLDQEAPELSKIPEIAVEYLKRVQAVTWNRKFIEGSGPMSNTESLFGLAPPETKIDDRICILFGCSVPCILRPCGVENGTQFFRFLGEAYIYGRMDGEAITMLSAEELLARTTEFVII